MAAIPPGRVVTYGQIAYLVGRPQCSRMVGHAMHDVPDGMCLPCHRVVNSLLDDAEYVCVAYGTSARICKYAINELRKEGIKLGLIRPITLYPFPKKVLHDLDYSRVKAIIDVEMTLAFIL